MTSIDTLQPDYRAITEACGLLDRSERGKLALSGADGAGFLQGQVSNDVESLAPGSGCYAAFLTPKGKMLGDIRILNAGDELLLDTERSALQALFNMIRRFSIGYQVELHKRTVECGLLSLIGPDADRLAGADWLPSEEHRHIPLSIGGIQVRAIRTDVGLDLLCDAADTDALRSVLEESGALVIGEAATESTSTTP
jgi:folate-binding Fe-S cluster repair protein YgfZ